MMTKLNRVLGAVLAFLVLMLPFGALAEETATGKMVTVQLSDLSFGPSDSLITLSPVLTLGFGADALNERGFLNVLMTLADANALNVIAAVEDGLVKVYAENMTSYIEIPMEQLKAKLAESGLNLKAQSGNLALGNFAGAFDADYAKGIQTKVVAAIQEKYPDWYQGETSITIDEAEVPVHEYKISLATVEEVAEFMDFFYFEMDEQIAAMMKSMFASMGVTSFTETLSEADVMMSLEGTLYTDYAGIALLNMALTGADADGVVQANITIDMGIMAADPNNSEVYVEVSAAQPEEDGTQLDFSIYMDTAKDDTTRSVSGYVGMTVLENGASTTLELTGSLEEDATNFDLTGSLAMDAMGEAIDVSFGFDGDWAVTETGKQYQGLLFGVVTGDSFPEEYQLSANLSILTQAMPEGALLTVETAGVNPLEMDEEALTSLSQEAQMVLYGALGVLMQDPALAALMGASDTAA